MQRTSLPIGLLALAALALPVTAVCAPVAASAGDGGTSCPLMAAGACGGTDEAPADVRFERAQPPCCAAPALPALPEETALVPPAPATAVDAVAAPAAARVAPAVPLAAPGPRATPTPALYTLHASLLI